MDKPQDPEAAETVQTTNVPAVDLPRIVRLLCDGRCVSRHECKGEARRVHVMLGSKDWGRYNYCDEARAEDKRNGYTVLFENVWCSQCGRDLGEGEHGFSRCSDHTGRQCANCRWSMTLEERYDQLRCTNDNSPESWGDVEATGCCESFLPNSVLSNRPATKQPDEA